MSMKEHYMAERYPAVGEPIDVRRNCSNCKHCRILKAADSKMRAWFKQQWLRINTINQHGQIYSQPVQKLLNETFATCAKSYWPEGAVCNPNKMGSDRDDASFFKVCALDCADYEG